MSAGDHRTAIAVGLALLAVGAMLAVPVTGQSFARGEPQISAHLPDNEVVPGSDAQLSVQLMNNGELEAGTQGDQVKTARGLTVEVRDDGPFEAKTQRTAVGTIPDGQVITTPIDLVIPDDVEPGEYDVTLRIRYSYTASVSPGSGFTNERNVRRNLDVTVRVVSEPRFSIVDARTELQPGTSGDAVLEIANVGSEPAYETRATVSGSGGVTIGGNAGTAAAYLGTLEPGESRNVTVDAALAESVSTGDAPIEALFRYRDANGIDHESRPAYSSLQPEAAQSISIENLNDTLSVGYDGVITGTVRNDGPLPIRDGVLVIEPRSDSLFIEERRYALPELAPNETAAFAFPTDVSGQADPGPRQVQFSVEYANDGRETITVGPVSERVEIGPRQPEFTVADSRIAVTAGGSAELVLEITNRRPETLRNVHAKLYTDSPLSASSDEAFVDELAPGESAELRFAVEAAAGTMPKTYPVELDFQYDTERGETVLSRTYIQPVDVTEPVDDGERFPTGLGIAAVVLVVLAVGGIVLYRRR